MQITADMRKICKTVQGDLIFLSDVRLVSAIGCIKSCLFRIKWFSLKRGGVRMHNYAEMYKGICAYNSVYNFFCIPFAIKKFSFCGALFRRSDASQHRKEALPKHGSYTKIVPLLVIFHLTQVIQRCECYDFTKLHLI